MENLLIPHTPWPLVHPFPILVPTPTNKPPRINNGKEFVIILSISFPENEYKRAMNNLIDIYFDLLSSDITNIEYIDLRISERAIIKLYNNNTNSL